MLKLNQIINTEEYSNTELITLILCDPALTAQILRLANSPRFGFTQQIDTVTDAVSVVGKQKLHNLIMSTTASVYSGFTPKLAVTESFWFRSFACGIVTHLLAAKTRNKAIERLFVTGLLHAIGKLVFFAQYPEESTEIPRGKAMGEKAAIVDKQERFDFTHVKLGTELLRQWQLPASIWQPIEFQLDPLNSNAPIKDTSLLHVALNITSSMEYRSCNPKDCHEIIPTYHIEACNQLGLNEKVIHSVKAETSLQILDILSEIKPEVMTIY